MNEFNLVVQEEVALVADFSTEDPRNINAATDHMTAPTTLPLPGASTY